MEYGRIRFNDQCSYLVLFFGNDEALGFNVDTIQELTQILVLDTANLLNVGGYSKKVRETSELWSRLTII